MRPVIGQRFDLFGRVWIVQRVRGRHVEMARESHDPFGKPFLIEHKTWHKADLIMFREALEGES